MRKTPLPLADWRPLGGVDIDWGNFPAWFGAIVTSLTFGFGLVLFARSLRTEREDQANQVAVHYATTSTDTGDRETRIVDVWVHNASDNIITRVEVHAKHTQTKEVERGRWWHPNDREFRKRAGSEWQVLPAETRQYKLELNGGDIDDYDIVLIFRDACSVGWQRDLITYRLKRRQIVYRGPQTEYDD